MKHLLISDCRAVRFAVIGFCACFVGCGFLKPARNAARHFVLTPVPAERQAQAATPALAVGLRPVKLPAYLFDTSLAVRKGANEIVYSPETIWAERLDSGLQNVLAANLRSLIPTDHVRLSAWRSEEVAVELSVSVEQFDVDAQGQAVLVASWRLCAPRGEALLKAGESRLTRRGPSPETDPSGAISTLSDLVAELSRQLAQALKEAPLSKTAAP